MIVAKYKFDKSIYENLIPVFNDGYEGYSISETNTKLDVYYTKLQAFSELISKITIEKTIYMLYDIVYKISLRSDFSE